MKKTLTTSERRFLERESSGWVTQDLLSEDARSAILGTYETVSGSERFLKAGLLTLLSLAVLLVGLSVLLLVCHNWAALSAAVKLTIVLGTMAAAYAMAGLFRHRNQEILAETAFFFGAILFGIGIWQIAQIFHVSLHYPQGIWFWAIGSLALAISLRTPLVHCLSAVLLTVWMASEILGFSHLGIGRLHGLLPPDSSWLLAWLLRIGRLPNAAWTLPLLAGTGWLTAGLTKKSPAVRSTIEFLYALTFCGWLLLLPCAWGCPAGTSFYFLMLGTMLFFLPQFLSRLRGRPISPAGKLCVTVGTITAGIALIPYSFLESWQNLLCFSRYQDHGYPPCLYFQSFSSDFLSACVGLELLFLFGIGLLSWLKKDFFLLRTLNFMLLLGAFSLVGFLFSLDPFCWSDGKTWLRGLLSHDAYDTLPFLLTLLQNVFMFAMGLSFIHAGLKRNLLSAFLFGVLYFLTWAIVRYVDLFSDIGGMLGAAGLFFFCALVLFGFSYYWFASRKALKGAENEQ